MNKFTISIKQDGEYQPIQATPVFPFSWGELLDERLDEAYITLYDSPEKTYKRLTDVKVTITNGSRVKDEYFIIASDNSFELPVGSGKYKHDIYLIERTKLLEGIFCSTITFTNSKGNTYTASSGKAPYQDIGDQYDYAKAIPDGFTSPIPGTIPAGTQASLPSAYEMANSLYPILRANLSEDFILKVSSTATVGNNLQPSGMVTYNSQCLYMDAATSATYTYYEKVDPTPSGGISLIYTLCYSRQSYLNGVLGDPFYDVYFLRFYLSAVDNKMPLKRWTITDCVIRACELAEPLFLGETPKYKLDGVEYDENGKVIKPYPVGTLAAKYDKVFAPEFTATEDTLREQLKLIFSYVHAEPWLDENDVIHVTDYGNVSESAAKSLPYVFSSVTSHINEYCTEIRSHAQNLASSLGYARGTIVDPGEGLYRSIRSDTAYVRINENNGVAVTSHPIYTISSVVCGIVSTSGAGWRLPPKDITQYVFEETEYSAHLDSYAGAYPLSKQYAIYYTQGSPNLKGLFYKAPDKINTAVFSPFAISNILAYGDEETAKTIDDMLTDSTGGAASLVFSITYKPISNHFVSHGKQLYVAGETPFMQLYNQSENLVESQYYGENLRGVAARLGNIEKERTFILKNINDVPRVGDMLDGYAISAVSCELYPFDIKCTVGLTKDFNRISEYVGINSQKRMYEVSERNAADRNILFKETLVIGTRPNDYVSDNHVFGDLTPFYNALDIDASNSDYKISVARFTAKKPNGENEAARVCLPVIARALGNMVTFNFAMKDNYSAGTRTQNIVGSGDDADEITGRWENDVPYSNYYGRAWSADIWLYRGNISGDFLTSNLAESTYTLPALDNNILPPKRAVIRLDGLLLRKDNRERLSYNIELDIKTEYEDIIIGSSLADLCGWVSDTATAPVIYYFDTAKHSIGKFDRLYTPHNDDIYAGTFSGLVPEAGAWRVAKNIDGSLTLTVEPRGTGRGWVICTPITPRDETVEDENGNPETVTYTEGGEILLASNTPIETPISLDFYVVKN